MKVLFYRYGSICEPDILWAFEFLKVDVVQMTDEIDNKDISQADVLKNVSSVLSEQKFDAVFSINYYPILSEVCRIYGIRYISWTVDSPVMELFSDTLANETNRTFVFDKTDYEYFKPYAGGHIFYLPLGVNTRRIDAFLEKTGPDPRFGGEVTMVGSLYSEKNRCNMFADRNSKLWGYLEALCDAQSKIYGDFILDRSLTKNIIDEFKRKMPDYYNPPERFRVDDALTMALLYLAPETAVRERRRILTALGNKFPVKLYTGSDSAGIPVKNCGRVRTLEEMPLVFRDSRINLNITLKSIRSGISQRVFDVLGCGGFLLTNYQSEIPELFDRGLVMFASDEELLSLTDYYLSHEKEREEIAKEGQAVVRAKCSIEARVLEMFETAFSI